MKTRGLHMLNEMSLVIQHNFGIQKPAPFSVFLILFHQALTSYSKE